MSEYIRNRTGMSQNEETEGFFCRFTFGQFFAILILEVFTLFFVFYLGARYGREFLGMDKMAQVETAQTTENQEAGAPEETAVQTTADADAKTARELVAKADTPELKERISQMFMAAKDSPASGNTPPIVDATRPQNKTDEFAKAEEVQPIAEKAGETLPPPPAAPEPVKVPSDTIKTEQALASPVEKEKPAPLPKDTGVVRVKSADNARYSVQVGSYPQSAEASRAAEKWKSKGYAAYTMVADIPERGRFYRVRLGGFASREDANRYLSEFKAREDQDAIVVMNEQ